MPTLRDLEVGDIITYYPDRPFEHYGVVMRVCDKNISIMRFYTKEEAREAQDALPKEK